MKTQNGTNATIVNSCLPKKKIIYTTKHTPSENREKKEITKNKDLEDMKKK